MVNKLCCDSNSVFVEIMPGWMINSLQQFRDWLNGVLSNVKGWLAKKGRNINGGLFQLNYFAIANFSLSGIKS